MPQLGTLGKSHYNDLLKGSIPGGAFFETALYPPVFQTDFNVGTVFSFWGNEINTVGALVSSYLYIANRCPRTPADILSRKD